VWRFGITATGKSIRAGIAQIAAMRGRPAQLRAQTSNFISASPMPIDPASITPSAPRGNKKRRQIKVLADDDNKRSLRNLNFE
jgi:hypothetical protein